MTSLKSALKDYEGIEVLLININNVKWVKDFNAWLRIKRNYSTRKNILWTHKRIIRDAVMDGVLIPRDMKEAYKVPKISLKLKSITIR